MKSTNQDKNINSSVILESGEDSLNQTTITGNIDLDLESEYWDELRDILANKLENPEFTKSMHKKSDANLKNLEHSISLQGDEFWAQIRDPKKDLFHEVKITFPLFDEYLTMTKCSCHMDKYLLDEKMCEHILCALKILKISLEGFEAGSTEEKKDWNFLFKSIDKAFDPENISLITDVHQSSTESSENLETDKKTIKWLLKADGTISVTPFIKHKDRYYESKIIDLHELNPTKDATFADWQLIHQIKGNDNSFQITSLSQLEILQNIDHVYSDKSFDYKIKIHKSTPGLKVESSEDGLQAIPTINGHTITDLISVGNDCICYYHDKTSELFFYKTSANEIDFFKSLLVQSSPIPHSERQNLIEYLMKIERKIPVSLESNIELKTKQTEPSNIIVRITPLNENGYRIDLLIKPNGVTPFPPGVGPETVLSRDKRGNAISLVRDFDMELELAREVTELSTLSSLYSQNGSYFYAANEQKIIEAIHGFSSSERLKEIVVIEWPKNYNKDIDVKEVGEEDVKVSIGCSDGNNNLFAVDGQIEIDGEILELKELIDQLRAQKRYIELPSSNWAFITKELEKKIMEISGALNPDSKENENHDLDLASALLLNDLSKQSEFIDLKHKNKKLKSIIENFEKLKDKTYETPSEIKANLRPYQTSGYSWLMKNYELGLGCVLADDMGLGKTLQTIALLTSIKDNGPSLVVLPTSLIGNWKSEISKFSPLLNVITLNDAHSKEEVLEELQSGDIVLVSYGIAVNNRSLLESVHWNTMVLDESQTVKNHSTQTAKEISKIPARWRLGLSGTPIENNLAELWSIFRVVSPGLLASFSTFRRRFILPIEKTGSDTQKDILKKIVAPFILRRLKSEILTELPPKIETIKTISLNEKERKFYEAARLEARERLEKKRGKLADQLEEQGLAQKDIDKQIQQKTRFDVLGTLMTLRQIAINPSLVDPEWEELSSKNRFLLDSLSGLAKDGHKSLVFSQFTRQLNQLNEKAKGSGLKTLYLDGSTKSEDRTDLVKMFQSKDYDVFFISLKAGGTGLNLTAADHVFHMDPWWNPAAEDQASDRAYRMGQKNTVNVIKLISADTVEEKIVDLHKKKKALSNSVLEGSDVPKDFNLDEYFNLI
jgi:SNF2 family DNA or RNA helicase